MTYLESIDVMEFLEKTASEVHVFGCQFGKTDCKNEWKTVKTLYGFCKEASPSDFAENDEYEEAPQSISLLLTYDLENWTPGGWAHYLEGFTVYHSQHDDEAFSPTNGILLADISRGVPIVSMYEKRTQLKGSHYSECVDENGFVGKIHKKLDFFPRYTKEQCRQECMLKNVLRK